MALFNLGTVVATPGALQHCEQHQIDPASLVARHANGDWGELCASDIQANTDALAFDGRLLSSYLIGLKKLYVITEWDRSATTLLLANEY